MINSDLCEMPPLLSYTLAARISGQVASLNDFTNANSFERSNVST